MSKTDAICGLCGKNMIEDIESDLVGELPGKYVYQVINERVGFMNVCSDCAIQIQDYILSLAKTVKP